MMRLHAYVRLLIGVLALGLIVAVATPSGAQQVNPTTSAVKEDQLLQQMRVISGRGTIPDTKSYNLEQPAGREWRDFHQVILPWIGAVAILGMLLVLVIFYMSRGTMRIEGGRSGRTILRFGAVERFLHWLTATTFIVLGITGLNITFGKSLLLPVIGPEAFSAWSEWAKYSHNYLSFAFTIGVVVMLLMWLPNNMPTRVDIEWLRRGGGLIGRDHPPAYKFNAGQKLLYWFILFATAAMAISGFMLMFPFYGTTIGDMQVAQIFHGVVSMLFIALILAHIYLGTLGMEGAFEAMVDGTVDVNWAKEHHNLWADQELSGGKSSSAAPSATPAE